jgi:hypothetical protein
LNLQEQEAVVSRAPAIALGHAPALSTNSSLHLTPLFRLLKKNGKKKMFFSLDFSYQF